MLTYDQALAKHAYSDKEIASLWDQYYTIKNNHDENDSATPFQRVQIEAMIMTAPITHKTAYGDFFGFWPRNEHGGVSVHIHDNHEVCMQDADRRDINYWLGK